MVGTLDLRYPALCFSQRSVEVKASEDELTRCTKVALKNGYYDNMVIVDGTGRGLVVRRARKIGGIGRFWGYNIFLNQHIRVELEAADGTMEMTVADVKGRVFDSFDTRPQWASRDDMDDRRGRITRAKTIEDVIRELSGSIGESAR